MFSTESSFNSYGLHTLIFVSFPGYSGAFGLSWHRWWDLTDGYDSQEARTAAAWIQRILVLWYFHNESTMNIEYWIKRVYIVEWKKTSEMILSFPLILQMKKLRNKNQLTCSGSKQNVFANSELEPRFRKLKQTFLSLSYV